MKKNDQITIDIEPAKESESARPWAKELRIALCEFLDEFVANNPAPIDLTIDVGPLTYNPTEGQRHACNVCGGIGTIIEGEQGAQYQAACENCLESVILRCPSCKSQQSTPRDSSDPENCAVIEITCPNCNDSSERQLVDYFDASGRQIDCDGNAMDSRREQRVLELQQAQL